VRAIFDHLAEGTDHPAILAGYVHVALLAVHPLADGNGRASRLLALLVMLRGGVRRPELALLDRWWSRDPDGYRAAVEGLGTGFDTQADVTPFLEAQLRYQLRAAWEPAPPEPELSPRDAALGQLDQQEWRLVRAVLARGGPPRGKKEANAWRRFEALKTGQRPGASLLPAPPPLAGPWLCRPRPPGALRRPF
jgi:hypothetical protein